MSDALDLRPGRRAVLLTRGRTRSQVSTYRQSACPGCDDLAEERGDLADELSNAEDRIEYLTETVAALEARLDRMRPLLAQASAETLLLNREIRKT